ncbi:MAG: transglycosylase SLT domain-containing protein [Acidobacteria bacterium]|nr:transglycosylase SLT domain-containing protein [Acidobacteriota bacterium]
MTRIGRRTLPLAGGLSLVALLIAVASGRESRADGSLWLAPLGPAGAVARPNSVAKALTQLADGQAAQALPVLSKASGDRTVGPYVRVHQGRAELAVGRLDAAAASAAAVLASSPEGYLRERALWLAADAAEARADWTGASQALSALTTLPLAGSSLSQAWYRLGLAAEQAEDIDLARQAFTRVHDEYPASAEGSAATAALLKLAPAMATVTTGRVPVALRRAQQLYDARKFEDARQAYLAVRGLVPAADRDVVDLRLAQVDARLKRHAPALQALQAYLASGGARQGEAEYTRLGVLREMGRHPEYIAGVRAFVDRAPDPIYAEAALNDLGTHYILTDEDATAAAVFTEQYDRYPAGPFAGRAAWKAGWWAFANANYDETIRLFESAAVGLRRADYRSGWVYWAARAHERLGRRDMAMRGYDQTIADYGNSYYGREAVRALERLRAAARPAGAGPVTPVRRDARVAFEPGPAPGNAALVQALLAAQLWADAVGELRWIQRQGGNAPVIDATLAYALNRQGELRLGISAMKRAYPQYMADGGEALPRDLKTVLFPVAYWPLIRKHAAAHKLDPFLVAALVAQESTFDPKIRSAADAWGLMQILPSTGRRYARTLKIRRFTTASLTSPEINVRIGTTYLSDLVKRFGGVAPALASYNAGENRVARWLAERPGLDRDEFIDNIPFPETQGYVKKIIGTAEDYRLLYRTAPAR